MNYPKNSCYKLVESKVAVNRSETNILKKEYYK